MKLSFEDKKDIIRLNKEEGISHKRIAAMYNLAVQNIDRLLRLYDIHGEEILIKAPNRKYSTEFKMEIMSKCQEGTSIRFLSLAYNISESVLSSWLSRYEKEGYNGLIDKKKGRPPKMKKDDNVIKSEDSDKTKTESTDKAKIKLLEKKNKELEAEVAYLKKLNALVQERKKRQSRKK